MNLEWGSRDGVNVYRLLSFILKKYLTQASDVIQFERDNAGMIANLPVKMRHQLLDDLSRIGSRVNETEPPNQQEPIMKASDAFPSKYLSAEDLGDQNHTLKITHVAEDEIGGKQKFVLFFSGQKKGLVLNKTNWNTIAKLCGEDSDDWTGQTITLFPTLVDFQGEQVAAIRVRSSVRATITTGKQPSKPAAAASDDPRSDADMDEQIPL